MNGLYMAAFSGCAAGGWESFGAAEGLYIWREEIHNNGVQVLHLDDGFQLGHRMAQMSSRDHFAKPIHYRLPTGPTGEYHAAGNAE